MTCPEETLHPLGQPLSMSTRKHRRSPMTRRVSEGLFDLQRPNGGGSRRSNASIRGAFDGSISNLAGAAASAPGSAATIPRAFSDTFVSGASRRQSSSESSLCSLGAHSYPSSSGRSLPRTNSTFSLVQRSGAPVIRELIATIVRKTEARTRIHVGNDIEGEPPRHESEASPHAECAALTNCARDPYYRVIVAASGGIVAVVRAMEAFRDDEQVQASGCGAFAGVCAKSTSNQIAVAKEGGIDAVLEAMRRFPFNVAVQGAGCDALDAVTSSAAPGNIGALLRQHEDDLQEVVECAMRRFLPPSCRESAERVLHRLASAR